MSDLDNWNEVVRNIHEKWKWQNLDYAPFGMYYATCPECGMRLTYDVLNFCQNCGADMRRSADAATDS